MTSDHALQLDLGPIINCHGACNKCNSNCHAHSLGMLQMAVAEDYGVRCEIVGSDKRTRLRISPAEDS